MAEKLSETVSESPAVEKKKSEVSGTSDELGETGRGEATTKSAVGTLEDHATETAKSQENVPVMKKQQKKGKSSKEEAAEGDSKPERSASRSPDKTSRTRSHKKSTSEKDTDVSKDSDQKTALEESPAKGATTPVKAEDATPPKSKSPSILMRLRSHSKLRSERSSSVPPDGSAKADEPRGKAKVEKSSEIYSPAKRRGPVRKAKSVDRERSKSITRSESMDTTEAEPNLKENDEKASKIKSKVSVKPKLPPTEQERPEEDTPTVKDPQKSNVIKLLSQSCEQVSSGIKSMQLSKTADDSVSLLCLDESIDSTSSGASGKEEIGAGKAAKVEEMGVGGGAASHWKPQHSHQEGGFQKDVIHAQFSSSSEDTGTEVSLVPPSSAIKGDIELKKGLSTSTDTLSEIPGLKEEEASGGQEQAEKSPPQGQKRVKGKESSDSDEDYKAASGSPVKKVAPESKSAELSSEE